MVTFSFLAAIAAYAFVTSITPGPNNTMLLASGVNFGFRASLPHMLGITIGFSIMLLAVGAGLGSIFTLWPLTFRLLQVIGATYLLYLAWKISRSGAPGTNSHKATSPFSFVQAAAFQWVNPKAWILAIGVVSSYLPQHGYFRHLAAATLMFGLVNFPCIAIWAGLGEVLRAKLSDPVVLRVFNYAMAVLLVLSLYPVLRQAA